MKSRIKIQIVPTRAGRWTVWVDGWRIVKSTRDPLVEIASRMIAAGYKPQTRIIMTHTPDGECRVASTIGDTAVASQQQHPFRAPVWTALQANGG